MKSVDRDALDSACRALEARARIDNVKWIDEATGQKMRQKLEEIAALLLDEATSKSAKQIEALKNLTKL